MKALTTSVAFSRREKLLLGLLGSTLLFSFSFSYGAVNQAKVDSIMQTINTAANNFSSQADRDTYYQRVYTGLSDAIDMLAVVRNNVGAMIGTAPVDMPPSPPNPPTPSTTDSRMGSCKTTAYAGSYSSAAKIDCTQAMTNGSDYGTLGLLNCKVDHTTTVGTMGIKPVAVGNGNFVIEYKPGIQGTYMPTSKYWTFTINAQSPGEQADTRVAKLEVAISSQPNDFTSSNVIQKGTSVYRTDQGLLTYTYFSPMLIVPRDYPHKLYINVRPLTYHDMTKGTRYADEEITAAQVSSRGLSLPTQSFYLIPNPLPWTNADGPNGANANLGWKAGFTQANYCLAGSSTSTTTPPSPPNPPTPPTPAPVTNPIANYPIPAPCSAGTVLNKELLGTINGAWIERAFSKASDIVPGHVYKLRIDEEDGQGNGGISWGDAPPERISQTVKISPYPCDFVTLEQEKKYWGNRINVAPSLTTWWDSVTVPASTTIGACMALGISGNHQYKIGNAFASPSISTAGSTCTLVKGVTYYVNIRPSFTHMHGNGCNGTYACNYHLVDGGSQKMPSARLQLWGIYNTYEEFLIYKLKANVSSENVESLRQKVVSDYATKGVNTDGLTNTALGGTSVTPPVGTGGGPVVVREGPWERIEDIFCPDTLDGPGGLRTLYPNGYNYTNQGNTYWNVKNYLTPTDNTLPASCTTGKKFVKHGMQATCYVYECKN